MPSLLMQLAFLQLDIKNQYILDKLKNVPTEKRGARFVCVIACVLPDGQTRTEPPLNLLNELAYLLVLLVDMHVLDNYTFHENR